MSGRYGSKSDDSDSDEDDGDDDDFEPVRTAGSYLDLSLAGPPAWTVL